MGTAKGDGYTVTPRDLELVVNAINCTRLPFELEYDKLARRLGYKNAQSAKAAWNALKKKLDKVAEGAAVVPSLTIEPRPLRKPAELKGEGSLSKKRKRPALEPSNSEEESAESASDDAPPPRPSKVRKSTRRVDDDDDVSMFPTAIMVDKYKKPGLYKHKHRPKLTALTNKRSRPSSSASLVRFSDTSQEPKVPRNKLKTKLKHLSVEDRAKGKDESRAELETAAFIARQKTMEGMEGDDDDEDDDEEPPPAYVKKESADGGEGVS